MIGGKELKLINRVCKNLEEILNIFSKMRLENQYEKYSSLLSFDTADDLDVARSDLSYKFPERFYHFQTMEYGVEIRYSLKDCDYYLACRCFTPPPQFTVRNENQAKLWRVKNGIINYGSFEDLDSAIHGFYQCCKYLIDFKLSKQWSLF